MIFLYCKCIDDDSRVCLEEIPGELGSDYINTSLITVRIFCGNTTMRGEGG